ncbi:hypothetical protein RHVG_00030 [Rhodovulum phage RS1]|uniref:terminase small subunit n=1 Tax=Rhodobacter phage RC1 TaxID=754055 RepID=UPI0002C1897D|nr:terminase small subunit [Rhodobacter phage RC1]YP_007676409.1 terminase small subunit [Rhodovulum phage RS1]AGH57995.1 hypothetical protein RHVG_00030 [Rhodovulum phage RS1]AGH58047.1 hypothetical protein RHWG_00026 [Rhodobacter phage RC1]
MSTGSRGRGRLSSIDLLPPECDGIIAWASQALADRDQTQTDIYAEFVEKCEALMAEHRGELEFTIPSFSSFNRHAVRLARLTHRLDQTRAIVASIADKFDPAESDNLTVMAAETLKALVLTMLAEADEDKVAATDVMRLATALKQAAQAQGVSSDRRRKVEADFKEKVEQAVTKVARAKGMTTETAEAIKSQILGV